MRQLQRLQYQLQRVLRAAAGHAAEAHVHGRRSAFQKRDKIRRRRPTRWWIGKPESRDVNSIGPIRGTRDHDGTVGIVERRAFQLTGGRSEEWQSWKAEQITAHLVVKIPRYLPDELFRGSPNQRIDNPAAVLSATDKKAREGRRPCKRHEHSGCRGNTEFLRDTVKGKPAALVDDRLGALDSAYRISVESIQKSLPLFRIQRPLYDHPEHVAGSDRRRHFLIAQQRLVWIPQRGELDAVRRRETGEVGPRRKFDCVPMLLEPRGERDEGLSIAHRADGQQRYVQFTSTNLNPRSPR